MMAVAPLITGVILVVGIGVAMILSNILGDIYIGICTLATAIPGMLIGLILMKFKVKETSGVDMSKVEA